MGEEQLSMSFEQLGLSANILNALQEKGYSEATPIQAKAIPVILQGRDLMAGAQTGTGKTAAFTLPILQNLTENRKPRGRARPPIRALILVPTRELAAQVHDNIEVYSKYLPVKSAVVFGGVSIDPQMQKLQRNIEVLVATPGRLLDLVYKNAITLNRVEMLVLDEADRMLDMGFIEEIRKIIKLLPQKRQNLLFSATFSDTLEDIADNLLHEPELIEPSTRNTTSEQISQLIYRVDRTRKRELLSHIIASNDWHQVLVFVRTKHGADRLANQLSKDGLTADAIHGDKSQGARTRALAGFKSGEVRVLVATDVAARGIDIDQLPHVINFELPQVAEDYVHRIGRTGRAGKEGQAISLVCIDEVQQLKSIEKLVKQTIEQMTLPGYEPDPSIKPQPLKKLGQNNTVQKSAQKRSQQPKPEKEPATRPQQRRRRKPIDKALADKADTGDGLKPPTKKIKPAPKAQ